jgi:hypothetical protein
MLGTSVWPKGLVCLWGWVRHLFALAPVPGIKVSSYTGRACRRPTFGRMGLSLLQYALTWNTLTNWLSLWAVFFTEVERSCSVLIEPFICSAETPTRRAASP